jgi:hypothetical protein
MSGWNPRLRVGEDAKNELLWTSIKFITMMAERTARWIARADPV